MLPSPQPVAALVQLPAAASRVRTTSLLASLMVLDFTPPHSPNFPLLRVPHGTFSFSCHWYPPSCCSLSPIRGRQQTDDVCFLPICSLGLQASTQVHGLHGPEPDKAQVSDSKWLRS